MFTELERTRLEKRDDASIDAKEKRYNDMIVRNKMKQWLDDSTEVLFALDKLPKKQIRKLATDAQVFNLHTIGFRFVDALEFAQIQGNSINDAVAVKTNKSIGDKWEKFARKPEEKDFMRNAMLFFILNSYRSYLEKSPALEEYFSKHIDEWNNWISKDIVTMATTQGRTSIQSEK
jgi:hypothetical protein